MPAAKEQTILEIPLVDLKAQYRAIRPEVDAAIQRVVNNTSFILAPALPELFLAVAAMVLLMLYRPSGLLGRANIKDTWSK